MGRPVILLHGLMTDGSVWAGLMADPPAPGLATVRHDLPGHGGRPPGGTAGIAPFAADVADRIGALGAPAILVGWSLGASVALHLTATRPDLVAGLVLTGATPRLRAAADFPDALAPARLDALAAGLAADYAGTAKAFCTGMAGRDRGVRDTLLAAALRADPAFAGATLRAAAGEDLRDRLGRMTAPATVIAAADDTITPHAAQAGLARAIGARLETVAEGGHAVFLTRPDLFRPALARALSLVPAQAQAPAPAQAPAGPDGTSH